MFVRGERVATLRPPKAAPAASGRPRYCRRCGGPLGLSPSATGGVRCLNCGAQPSLGVQSQTHPEARDFALPRPYATIPIVPDTAPQPRSVTGLGRPISTVQDPQSVTSVAWSPPRATLEMARVRVWMRELSRPSPRTMITAAAAGIAVLAAITVSMTLA